MVTTKLDIVQWYCVVCVEFIVIKATIYIVRGYCVMLESIVVTTRVDIVQCYSVVL